MIYLDNAATSCPKPPCVISAVAEAMTHFGNSGRGAHPSALDASRVIYDTRVRLGQMFHCAPARVCFTPNSTAALNMAISGLFSPGDHILSTDLEHNSVLRPLYRLRDAGASVSFLPADGQGRVDWEALSRLVRPETRGIVCTHASNVTGDVTDLAAVGRFARERGLLFVVDASQTAGLFPIDMAVLGIDALCFTGHKSLLGPQGTGGLCLADGVDVRPLLVGGTGVQSLLETQPEDYPTHLEAGTLNGHGIAGLHAALQYIAESGLDTLRAQACALARRFEQSVRALPGITLYGDCAAAVRAPIVTLNLAGMDAAAVSDALSVRFGIATRPGVHCAPRLHRAMGTAQRGAVRFSWSHASTEAETDAAVEAVAALCRESGP